MSKINDIAVFGVPPSWVLVRIRNDEGMVGWGEAGAHLHSEAVIALVEAMGADLIGEAANRIEYHWQELRRSRFHRGGPIHASATAALDIALWDLRGREIAVPLYELLGGQVRDRIRVYGWLGGDAGAEEADELVAEARRKAQTGFSALKAIPAPLPSLPSARELEREVGRLASVRAAIPDLEVAVDFHGRIPYPAAGRLIDGLASAGLLFIEEPVLPEHREAFARLAARSSTPLATGERLYSAAEFLLWLGSGMSIAQPDVSLAGGVSECRRIANLAELWDVPVAPHCSTGPVALAASLQLCAALPNASLLEYNADSFAADYGRYLVDTTVFDVRDGHVELPTGSGLGIEIDEEAVVRAAEQMRDPWRPSRRHHRDGSVAEW